MLLKHQDTMPLIDDRFCTLLEPNMDIKDIAIDLTSLYGETQRVFGKNGSNFDQYENYECKTIKQYFKYEKILAVSTALLFQMSAANIIVQKTDF